MTIYTLILIPALISLVVVFLIAVNTDIKNIQAKVEDFWNEVDKRHLDRTVKLAHILQGKSSKTPLREDTIGNQWKIIQQANQMIGIYNKVKDNLNINESKEIKHNRIRTAQERKNQT